MRALLFYVFGALAVAGALGMVAAARVSHGRGHCGADVIERIERLLKRAGLPVAVPSSLAADDLAAAIERDKKARDGKVKFVCVDEIGRTSFAQMTTAEIVALAR